MFTCTSILDQLHNTELCVLQFCRLWLHLLFSMTSVGVYRRHIITDAVKVGTYTSHNLTVIIVTLLCFLNWPTTWSKAAVHMLWANKRLRPSTRPSWRKTWFHIFQRIRFLSVCCCPAFQGIFCLLLSCFDVLGSSTSPVCSLLSIIFL